MSCPVPRQQLPLLFLVLHHQETGTVKPAFKGCFQDVTAQAGDGGVVEAQHLQPGQGSEGAQVRHACTAAERQPVQLPA